MYSHLYNAFCGYDDNFFYSIVNNQENVTISGIHYYKFSYYFNATLTRSEAIQAWNNAQTIANGLNAAQPFDDQVNYVYGEICDNIEYHGVHNAYPSDGCDTAYSLCTGHALCSGFTGSFCLICYHAGLNAIPLWGRVFFGDSYGGHAWNLIEVGNTWKQVDCTNDMVLFGTDLDSTFVVYNYFTTNFKQSHIINTTQSGWVNTSVGRTYIDPYGYSKAETWLQDNIDWCYLDYYGRMVINYWAQDSHGTCWMDANGHITRSQWKKVNGYWYYLKSNGYRAESEWAQDNTDWCYLGSDGKMVTSSWAQDSVGWCYLDSTGHITRSQWLLKNNEWYYLKADGHMAANEWAQDNTGWCWMDSNGHITKSQWLHNNGYWYYLKANGYMAANEWVEDSVGWCYMGSNGRMVTNDWAQDSVGWCYMDGSGHITRSQWKQVSGYWYYLKSTGYRAESEWAQDSNGYCWMQSNGRWDSGTKWIGSPRYIGSSYILSGHRVDSRTIAIDGYNCTFNGGGKLVSFSQITGPTPEPV